MQIVDECCIQCGCFYFVRLYLVPICNQQYSVNLYWSLISAQILSFFFFFSFAPKRCSSMATPLYWRGFFAKSLLIQFSMASEMSMQHLNLFPLLLVPILLVLNSRNAYKYCQFFVWMKNEKQTWLVFAIVILFGRYFADIVLNACNSPCRNSSVKINIWFDCMNAYNKYTT